MIAFRITRTLGVNKDDVRHVLAFLAVDELHIAARNSVRNREVDEKLLFRDRPVLDARQTARSIGAKVTVVHLAQCHLHTVTGGGVGLFGVLHTPDPTGMEIKSGSGYGRRLSVDQLRQVLHFQFVVDASVRRVVDDGQVPDLTRP